MDALIQKYPKLFKQYRYEVSENQRLYCFSFVTIIVFILFIIVSVINASIVEISTNYSEACTTLGGQCTKVFTIDQNMKAPIYVYYELDPYFQNYRRYIVSQSRSQLNGNSISLQKANSECYPMVTNSDIGKSTAIDGSTPLDPNAIASPCGLIAYSHFTDILYLYKGNNLKTMNFNDISVPGDAGKKFKKLANAQTHSWIDVEDSKFVVWMRISALPYVRKLYAIIDQDLVAGTDYEVRITNNFDANLFKGQKFFILSTSGPFGGKNYACQWLLLALTIILVFILLALKKKQQKSQQKNND